MNSFRPRGLGLTVLVSLAACSLHPAADSETSKAIAIRVAGFVETAGIT